MSGHDPVPGKPPRPCAAQHEEFNRRIAELLTQYPSTSFVVSVRFSCGAHYLSILGASNQIADQLDEIIQQCQLSAAVVPKGAVS